MTKPNNQTVVAVTQQLFEWHSTQAIGCTLRFAEAYLYCCLPVQCECAMFAGGKAEALAGVGQGLLQPFHVNRFAAGHNATDFPRWLASDELFDVRYTMVSSLS